MKYEAHNETRNTDEIKENAARIVLYTLELRNEISIQKQK